MINKFLVILLLVALFAIASASAEQFLTDDEADILTSLIAAASFSDDEAGNLSDSEDALSSAGEAAARFAIAQQGACYSQASRLGPNSYDCSGLMLVAWKNAGYKRTFCFPILKINSSI